MYLGAALVEVAGGGGLNIKAEGFGAEQWCAWMDLLSSGQMTECSYIEGHKYKGHFDFVYY